MTIPKYITYMVMSMACMLSSLYCTKNGLHNEFLGLSGVGLLFAGMCLAEVLSE